MKKGYEGRAETSLNRKWNGKGKEKQRSGTRDIPRLYVEFYL